MWKCSLTAYGTECIQIRMKEMKPLFDWKRGCGQHGMWREMTSESAGSSSSTNTAVCYWEQGGRRISTLPPPPGSAWLLFSKESLSVCVSAPAWSQTSAKVPCSATGGSSSSRTLAPVPARRWKKYYIVCCGFCMSLHDFFVYIRSLFNVWYWLFYAHISNANIVQLLISDTGICGISQIMANLYCDAPLDA